MTIFTAVEDTSVNDDCVLPVHFRDDDTVDANGRLRLGEICDFSGTGNMLHGCPRGCSGATSHYANDGHPWCEEPE
jgi:hypothetical protein